MIPINRSWLLRGRSANLDASCLPSTMDWALSHPWRKDSRPGDSPDTSPQALVHDGGGRKNAADDAGRGMMYAGAEFPFEKRA